METLKSVHQRMLENGLAVRSTPKQKVPRHKSSVLRVFLETIAVKAASK